MYINGILETTASYPGIINYDLVADDSLHIANWGYLSWEKLF